MSMNPDLTGLGVGLLAFVVGFASQRGSVCGVLAARQIVETGRASRLVAFLTASLWALVVVVPMVWLLPDRFKLIPSYVGAAAALLGGALYGAGTVVNGACVFGTASRALSGNLSFFAALPGIAVGAGLGASLGIPPLRARNTKRPPAKAATLPPARRASGPMIVTAAKLAGRPKAKFPSCLSRLG